MAFLMIFLPIFLSIVLYLATRKDESLTKYIAMGWFGLQLVYALILLSKLPAHGMLDLGTYLSVPQFNFDLKLQVDALSVIMLILTAGLLLLVSLTSWEEKNQGAYFSLLVLFSGPIFGVFMTTNVMWFFMFWELTLLPMLFLVGVWGEREGFMQQLNSSYILM